MRKLGLIGGMSWVSTALYYEAINKAVSRQAGGLGSAPLIIESVNFAEVAALQSAGEWERLGEIMSASARRLADAGAEGLMVCSNTMHKVYDRIAAAVEIPILHIGEITAQRLASDGVARAGLLGTRFTMGESFYRDRIEAAGIRLDLPDAAMRAEIDRIIFDELTRGIVSRESQRTLRTCLVALSRAGSRAVILGCTELVMLVDPRANLLPVYDTTAIHAQAGADWILGGVNESREVEPRAIAALG